MDETTSKTGEGPAYTVPETPERDGFSYANYEEVRVANADFDLTADFDKKTFAGSVTLDLDYVDEQAGRLILDANDLAVTSVEASTEDGWTGVAFTMSDDEPLMGSALEITFDGAPEQIRIVYETSPKAKGLQWLTPEQTAGKTRPFLFSQFQPLNARSFAPLQDTPAVRMTYSARIRTPQELIAVMGAEQDPDGVRDGDYTFKMPQAIPSYLIAIAIGDIRFQPITETIGVYAEESVLASAVAEFEDTPKMEEAITALYGPYQWGRYDMIVLPPSFPYGGMENPRLSFLTPTLIAGDKSLTATVAHELAHSWSGNLVTNALWRDAWLNEGFTTYVENRTMEALYGPARATMERALDLESLKRDIENAARPEMTALKMPSDLEHPFDAFSQVSYAGGMFFVKFLEDRFGREAFDAFLKAYMEEFAFQSITTEDFLVFFEANLWAQNREAVTKEEIDAWIYQPGLPSTIPVPISDAFRIVSEAQAQWLGGEIAPGDIATGDWSAHEWLHFINTLPEDLSNEQFAALDEAFSFSGAQNAEIAYAWYMKAINGGYGAVDEELRAFLIRVGRGKFIYRLYAVLIEHGRRDWARAVYDDARPGYHPIAQGNIDKIFAESAG